MIRIDAIGEVCPVPLVKAKNALKEIGENGVVLITVDNEISKENLEKISKEMGFAYTSKLNENNIYEVKIVKGKPIVETEETPLKNGSNTIIVISSEKMGEGNEELGKTLMKSFIYAVSEMERLPKSIIFYNAGVFLVTENSPVLDDLKKIASFGCEIISCGACLNFYDLTEKLSIGEISNMYSILEKMDKADKIIKP